MTIGFITVSLLATSTVLPGCTPAGAPSAAGPAQAPTSMATSAPIQPTSAPPALPALALSGTPAKRNEIADLDAAHSPANRDPNEYLILGDLPVERPAPGLPPELAVFLGRWEGYSYAPPVKKDGKVVLVVQEMTAQGGKAFIWSGTNLQYPDVLTEIHFRVILDPTPSLEYQFAWPKMSPEIDTLTYDHETGFLRAVSDHPGSGPYVLTRDRSFHAYKDYAQDLAGKRIYPRTYQDKQLQHYGQGYLLYLPEGYETTPTKSWPLIFFLHGYGDRGDNLLLLAKASPFMFIREQGPLPFIIVAPLLNADYSSFPGAYLDGVLTEVQADYRVDLKRIYMTGLSMGGEATYRLAVCQPETFAAIAPLSAYVDSDTLAVIGRIKDLPVWAIHGADDTVIPLARGREPATALQEAGGNIRFSILEGHDHDTWTDTYSDPAFYDWLLQHRKP